MSKNNFSLKQAISPVISVILLLSITVIISLGLYQFLTNYVQDTQRTVENNAILDSLQIRSIFTDSDQSIIQTPFEQINISKVIYEGVECTNNSGVVSGKPLRVNMSSCAQASGQSSGTLTIETDEGVIQQQIRIEDTTSSSTSTSSSSVDCSTIPGDWIEVPGNSYFGTDNFCVMQFEAKDVSGVATSQPSSTPWVSIDFPTARSACTDLNTQHSSLEGTFKMITNREWMTIARNAEQQSTNWDSGTVGSGSMYRGHSDNNPSNALSVSDTGDYYDGTGNSAPSIERRVLELSNGEVIWDLGGNVREWVDMLEDGSSFNGNACSGASLSWSSYFGNDGENECNFNSPYSKDSAADTRYEMGPLGDYNADEGVGQIYSRDFTGRALLRGGLWLSGARAGAFAAYLFGAPSSSDAGVGFRCSYEP